MTSGFGNIVARFRGKSKLTGVLPLEKGGSGSGSVTMKRADYSFLDERSRLVCSYCKTVTPYTLSECSALARRSERRAQRFSPIMRSVLCD